MGKEDPAVTVESILRAAGHTPARRTLAERCISHLRLLIYGHTPVKVGDSMYYDMDGKPMEMEGWAASFEDTEARRLGWTQVFNWHVSTVWLGLDHSWTGVVPITFESMVFGAIRMMKPFETPDGKVKLPAKEVQEDQYMRRYPTKRAALIGHWLTVAWALWNYERFPEEIDE